MRSHAALIGSVLLAGCGQEANLSPRPAEADLIRLEAKLARHACVGDLNLWERSYRFHRNPRMLASDAIDFSVIEFHYRQAGPITLVAGRNVVAPDDSANWPDSPAVRTLSGRYGIKSGIVNVSRCTPLAQPISSRGR